MGFNSGFKGLSRERSPSCDSDAPQVRTARSDSTRVVKVNRRKTRPYCIIHRQRFAEPTT